MQGIIDNLDLNQTNSLLHLVNDDNHNTADNAQLVNIKISAYTAYTDVLELWCTYTCKLQFKYI